MKKTTFKLLLFLFLLCRGHAIAQQYIRIDLIGGSDRFTPALVVTNDTSRKIFTGIDTSIIKNDFRFTIVPLQKAQFNKFKNLVVSYKHKDKRAYLEKNNAFWVRIVTEKSAKDCFINKRNWPTFFSKLIAGARKHNLGDEIISTLEKMKSAR